MKLIGITGKARSGKDEIAKHLWAQHCFTRIALADPLKLAAQAAFRLTHAQTFNDELKEVVIPHWGLSPRQIFQKTGDIYKAAFGEDFWIKRWCLSYDMFRETDNVVVPDIRFDEEAAVIKELGGTLIRVVRGGGLAGAEGKHRSETGITLPVDFTINNDGSLEDLWWEVDRIMRSLA
jgi:hypothetical protein